MRGRRVKGVVLGVLVGALLMLPGVVPFAPFALEPAAATTAGSLPPTGCSPDPVLPHITACWDVTTPPPAA